MQKKKAKHFLGQCSEKGTELSRFWCEVEPRPSSELIFKCRNSNRSSLITVDLRVKITILRETHQPIHIRIFVNKLQSIFFILYQFKSQFSHSWCTNHSGTISIKRNQKLDYGYFGCTLAVFIRRSNFLRDKKYARGLKKFWQVRINQYFDWRWSKRSCRAARDDKVKRGSKRVLLLLISLRATMEAQERN